MKFSLRTDELCHWVVFSLCADRSCDAVVLQDGQEELNKVWGVGRSDHIQHLGTQSLMGLPFQLHPQQHPVSPKSSFLAPDIRSGRYLCDKVSNERDIRVEFLQTFANVTDDRQHVSAAQKVNHSVQQGLLQLQLTGTRKQHNMSRKGGGLLRFITPMNRLTEQRKRKEKPTCSMTSSWLCSVSKSLMSRWRTCGWSSWWHVQICVVAGLMLEINTVINEWKRCGHVVPHPVRLNGWEYGQSVAGSTAARTPSSPPILKPP